MPTGIILLAFAHAVLAETVVRKPSGIAGASVKARPYPSILGPNRPHHKVDRLVVNLLTTIQFETDQLDNAPPLAHLECPKLNCPLQVSKSLRVKIPEHREHIVLQGNSLTEEIRETSPEICY